MIILWRPDLASLGSPHANAKMVVFSTNASLESAFLEACQNSDLRRSGLAFLLVPTEKYARLALVLILGDVNKDVEIYIPLSPALVSVP